MMCQRWQCENYDELDDGEDADGNPCPPCPVCNSGGRICGLPEEWMGETECIGQYEERYEK